MKRKKIIVLVSLAILIVALLSGYTFSKYKQSVDIKSTTGIARWSFSGQVVNSKNSSVYSNISLADTIETDSIAEKRIAPGTKGNFQIVVDGTGSEIDIGYDIELVNETNKPQNLIFTYDNQKFNDLSSLISKLKDDETKEFSGKILHSDENKEKTYTIAWEWPYETTINGLLQDEIDLQDGKTISDYVFTLKITGNQIA